MSFSSTFLYHRIDCDTGNILYFSMIRSDCERHWNRGTHQAWEVACWLAKVADPVLAFVISGGRSNLLSQVVHQNKSKTTLRLKLLGRR